MADQISQNSLTLGVLMQLEAAYGGEAAFEGGSVEWSTGYMRVKRGGVRGQGVAIYDGTVRFDLDAMQVVVRVERIEDEHRVAGVELIPQPGTRLTGRGLRSASLGRLMEKALRALTVAVISDDHGRPQLVGRPGDPDRELVPQDVKAAQRASAADRRFLLLARVAEVYREALRNGHPSTGRTVFERIPEIPSETAARQRVRDARKAGVLGTTSARQKGDEPRSEDGGRAG